MKYEDTPQHTRQTDQTDRGRQNTVSKLKQKISTDLFFKFFSSYATEDTQVGIRDAMADYLFLYLSVPLRTGSPCRSDLKLLCYVILRVERNEHMDRDSGGGREGGMGGRRERRER